MGFDSNTCKREIEGTECDVCTKKYHYACDSLTQKEIFVWEKSTTLKLFCVNCTKSPEAVQTQNTKTMLEYSNKIDFYAQSERLKTGQIINDVGNIKGTIEYIKDHVSKLGLGNKEENKSANNKSDDKMLYAAVAKKAGKLPLRGKPKENSENSTTKIKKNKSFQNVKASGLRKMKNGDITINCQSQEARGIDKGERNCLKYVRNIEAKM